MEGVRLAHSTVNRLLKQAGLMQRPEGEPEPRDRRRFSWPLANDMWQESERSDSCHSRFGSAASNRRCTRSGATATSGSLRVVPRRFRRATPCRQDTSCPSRITNDLEKLPSCCWINLKICRRKTAEFNSSADIVARRQFAVRSRPPPRPLRCAPARPARVATTALRSSGPTPPANFGHTQDGRQAIGKTKSTLILSISTLEFNE